MVLEFNSSTNFVYSLKPRIFNYAVFLSKFTERVYIVAILNYRK